MCELLGMECNVPTDIVFSFSGLALRGGLKGPHADGWGLALYQGRAVRTFLEPTAAAVSPLADFVRSRPAQPLDAFLAQTEAAMTHDAGPVLRDIAAPTLVTVGAHDLVCSPRFAERINSSIGASELVVFEHLSHGALHEDPATFNRATVEFLLRQRSLRPRPVPV